MKKLLILGLTALVLAGCAVNPVTGKKELSLMSESQEMKMGRDSYPLATQASGGEFRDRELNAYVNSVGKNLAARSHRPTLDYQFNVVNDSGVNAYALPGGKISITRGLLAKMDNEAELAGVLGHEIGHVTARHAAEGYTRQVLAGVILGVGGAVLEASDIEGREIIAGGSALAAGLDLMKYSRDQERQSDGLGMQYMTDAGYNPEGFVQTMEILEGLSKNEPSVMESMTSSHPLSRERVADAKKAAGKYPAALKTQERLRRDPFQVATRHLKEVQPSYELAERGMALVAKGKNDEGLKDLRKAAKEAPGEAKISTMLASAEYKAGNPAAAEWEASRAVELDPELFDARLTAGVIYYKRKENGKSLGELGAAEKLVPGQPQVAFFRGRNLDDMGQKDKAAKEYAFVLKNVNKGPMAEYSYKRLTDWGYIKPEKGK